MVCFLSDFVCVAYCQITTALTTLNLLMSDEVLTYLFSYYTLKYFRGNASKGYRSIIRIIRYWYYMGVIIAFFPIIRNVGNRQ